MCYSIDIITRGEVLHKIMIVVKRKIELLVLEISMRDQKPVLVKPVTK